MGLRVRLLHLQGSFERVEVSQQGLWANRADRVQSSENLRWAMWQHTTDLRVSIG